MAWLPPSSRPEPASPWRCERRLLSPVAPRRPSSPCLGSDHSGFCGSPSCRGVTVFLHPIAGRIRTALDLASCGTGCIRWTIGTAVMLERDAGGHGQPAGSMTQQPAAASTARCWPTGMALRHDLLKPIGWPRHPIAMARFGLLGLRSARAIAESHFKGIPGSRPLRRPGVHTRFCPWSRPLSAAFGLVLGITGTRRRLAHSARRGAVHRGCARGLPAESWRHDHHQRPGCFRSRNWGDPDLTLSGCDPQTAAEYWR